MDEYKLTHVTNVPEPVGFFKNILRKHNEFLKHRPISPILSPVYSLQPIDLSNETASDELVLNPEKNSEIKSCQYHVLVKPSKPCVDCFVANYFKSSLFTCKKSAAAAIQLKKF